MPKGIYTRKIKSIEERFLSYVKPGPNGCLLWTGTLDTPGYGKFFPGGQRDTKLVRAHNWFYVFKRGPVPEGLILDHLCRVRHCVNPDHLEPVTPRENNLRGQSAAAINARKTHCPKGHLYELSNLIIQKNGGRRCRECNKIRHRNRKATKLAMREKEMNEWEAIEEAAENAAMIAAVEEMLAQDRLDVFGY